MTNRRPKALVVTGDGINCEVETANAFRLAGFDAEIRHLSDLIAEKIREEQLFPRYSVVAFPGGFSFGDDLTSGKVLALKIRHGLGWELTRFAERGGLVIGICNGFQALIRLGIFGKDISITQNSHGKFQNSWVKVTPHAQSCLWLKGIGSMDLPIRHGEGRLVFNATRKTEVLSKLDRKGMTCLKYDLDPNGSDELIAGLCDASGRIFGLMPHPEAFVRWTSHPEWTIAPGRANAPGQGLSIFENAYQEAMRVF